MKLTTTTLAISLLILSTLEAAADLKIERAQRQLQARYFFLTSNYIVWPDCTCGKAPQYPRDGFYGDISKNPELGVKLVHHLADMFFNAPGGFCGRFVKSCDNVTNLVPDTKFFTVGNTNSGSFDFHLPLPDEVNETNYMAALTTVDGYLSRLDTVIIDGGQRWNGPDGPHFGVNQDVDRLKLAWAQGKNFTTNALATLDCDGLKADVTGEWKDVPVTGAIEVRMKALITTTNCAYANDAADLVALTGALSADLTAPRYTGGSGVVWMKVNGPRPEDYNNCVVLLEGWLKSIHCGPPVDADGVFHPWSDGGTVVGGTTFGSAPFGYADLPKLPDCDSGDEWAAKEWFVLFKPQWDPRVDDVPCGGCGCVAGTTSVKVGSMQVKIELGNVDYGTSAGYLLMEEKRPSSDLIHTLRYSIDQNWSLVAPGFGGDGLAYLLLPANNTRVDIARSVGPPQTITITFSSGIQNPTTFKTVTIANGATINDVIVTEATDSENKTYVFKWTGDPEQWELKSGVVGSTFLRRETFSTVTNQTGRTETYTILNPDGTTAYQEKADYYNFSWWPEKTNLVVDPGGANLTTTWHYYLNGIGSGQVQDVAYPSGKWEKYSYDSDGRTTQIVTQFKNNAFNSPDSSNRVTTITYEPVSPDYTVVESLAGTAISKRKVKTIPAAHWDPPVQFQTTEIQFRSPTAAEDDPANLTTTNLFHINDGRDWKPIYTIHPDGTWDTYDIPRDDYENLPLPATKTITTKTGQYDNLYRYDVVDGTKTVATTDLAGNPVSNRVYRIQPNQDDILISSEVYSNPDLYGRPQRVTYLDGTHADTVYGCCGVQTTIDKEGTQGDYLYDELRRQIGVIQTSLGISTTNVLDAAGNVRSVTRVGSDNSTILLQSTSYDHAGRITAQFTPLDGVTTFAYTGNGTVKTTTYTNGATRVETYFQDGQLASVSGTAAHPLTYNYGADTDGAFSAEFKGTNTSATEYVVAWTDFLGRPWKTACPDSAAAYSYYNNLGQLTNQVDPDGVATVFQYNARGEQAYTAIDLNRNGGIDLTTGGVPDDRITRTARSALPSQTPYNTDVNLTETWVWTTEDDTNATLVARTVVSTDGLTTWQTAISGTTEATTTTATQYGLDKTVTQTNPDGTKLVNVYRYGRLTSSTTLDSTSPGLQIGQTTYDYDVHGRMWRQTDARNGTTVYGINSLDQVTSVSAPPAGNGEAAQMTTTYYNSMGQAIRIVYPDGTSLTNAYTLRGEIVQTSGSRAYPTGYGYDSQGRLTTMTNWSAFPNTGARITTWNYNPYRGWLDSKYYPNASTGNPSTVGPTYTYWPSGRLHTRLWARGTNTTYTYNNAGEIATISYNDGATPAASFTYDRRGRQQTVTQGQNGWTLAYTPEGQLLSETGTAGLLNGLAVTSTFDSLLRRITLATMNGGTTLTSHGYSFDVAGRLGTASDGAYSANYYYLANSSLIDHIDFKNGGTVKMTTSKQYDKLNRLTQISSARYPGDPPGPSAFTFNYQYNSANQRTRVDVGDGTYWIYLYDKLGQVISGKRYWSEGTPVPGQQFEYGFDDIGNRTSTKAGGDSSGTGLRPANYSANYLNQYTSRDVPGTNDIIGIANATWPVTVSGQTTYRHGEYFQKALAITNSTAAAWTNITATATNTGTGTSQSQSGHEFLPKRPENFGYDLDGNLTSDGRWTYAWDGENRLIRLLASTPNGTQRLDVDYDWRGRRIHKTVWANTNGTGNPLLEQKLLYDGWNLIAILNAQSSILQSFLWGTDLSGTMQGAGGVGGLLSMKDFTSPSPTNYFYVFDGNGNVMALASADTGALAAQYEHGPFGEHLRATAPMAKANAFRFSTKYQDDESGLVYYGLRYFAPSTGNWHSSEPLAEIGGPNLFAFLYNSPLDYVDVLGAYGMPTTGGANPGNIEPLIELLEEAEGVVVRTAPRRIPVPLPPGRPAPLPPTGGPRPFPRPPVQPVPKPSPKPVPLPDPVPPRTDEKPCKCKYQRVPPAGGDAYHNEYAAWLQNGEKRDFLVTVRPDGPACQYDAAVKKGAVVYAYEAKTKHSFLLNDSTSPKIIESLRQRFTRCAAVAKKCGLEYVIAVDNKAGYQGFVETFPGFNIQYIPFSR